LAEDSKSRCCATSNIGSRFRGLLPLGLGLFLCIALSALAFIHGQRQREALWAERQRQLQAMTDVARPLVRALRQHALRTGAFPSGLAVLEGTWGELPRPPAEAKTEWQYATSADRARCELAFELPGDFYPFGASFWCTCVFRSDQHYPRSGYGGVLVWRGARWALYAE